MEKNYTSQFIGRLHDHRPSLSPPPPSALFQMVIPADSDEMLQFQEQCVSQCQCAVDISLPLAYILLPSKQAFQNIYNRYVKSTTRASCVLSVHIIQVNDRLCQNILE